MGFWIESSPETGKTSKLTSNAKNAAFIYRAVIPVALCGWYVLVYIAYMTYGTNVSALYRAVWTDANASGAFMTIDVIFLFLALLLYLAYHKFQYCVKALLLTVPLGPGAATAYVMADMEVDRGAGVLFASNYLKED